MLLYCRLPPRHQKVILSGYEHSKIVPINIECNIEVSGMQVRLGWIVKVGYLRSR